MDQKQVKSITDIHESCTKLKEKSWITIWFIAYTSDSEYKWSTALGVGQLDYTVHWHYSVVKYGTCAVIIIHGQAASESLNKCWKRISWFKKLGCGILLCIICVSDSKCNKSISDDSGTNNLLYIWVYNKVTYGTCEIGIFHGQATCGKHNNC